MGKLFVDILKKIMYDNLSKIQSMTLRDAAVVMGIF